MTELRCSVDMDSKSGGKTANRKIKGTIHWVEKDSAIPAEVRLYDYLLTTDENGNTPENFVESLNKNSLEVVTALIEPSVKYTAPGTHYQFLRMGYFTVDADSEPDKLIFNRSVGLKDSWAKVKDK